ncbi:MmgE/PrpD family protein [Roseovarius sp.]|uniref:MmgE/PrpD family protein n=1 Tax=Roseovarius sp. TaxID=1486281 RepID=UPI002632B6C3|nr:MmgE/PrpD family protein [Roseovarius sp.]MDM8165615.1 MmgE/PrpD family protein [Roseovarius sp.]
MAFTQYLIDLSLLPRDQLQDHELQLARYSLLDWITCGIAGIGEPLAEKLRQFADREGGMPVASVLGGTRVPPRMAALVNGATSHALDYDDTHFAHVGHLSVGIYPAALAAGEEQEATVPEVVEAFLVGAEVAIRVGVVLGSAHYNLGFHQTATAGAFGATAAAGRLYGLDEGRMRAALSLCATRASGLKSQFGTMGKPYNAGIAAANGVECAQLAGLGFTAADDGLMAVQGFVETHTPEANPAAGWSNPPPETFMFRDNKYKLHACCHGLHAMIEALSEARSGEGLELADVTAVHLRTAPRWLRVCNNPAPRTGLEAKFSYKWLAGMTLRGDATGSGRTYTDEICADPELTAFANRVTVEGDEGLSDAQAEGELTLADGRKLAIRHDLDALIPKSVLAGKLRTKAEAVLGPRGIAIWDRLAALDDMDARTLGNGLSG